MSGNDTRSRDARPVAIAPSLMCADQGCLAEEIEALEAARVDLVHLDVMDARFAPNMPLGLGVIESLRGRTRLPFDVHLMVEDNDWFIEQVARIGVERIAVHFESARHADRSLAKIRDHGASAGIALNPGTPLEALEFLVERLDFVLLMTVNPGFAGQSLVPSALRKIAACRRRLDALDADVSITVDGNVSFANIADMVAAGADTLVAGSSSLYAQGAARAENTRRVRELIAQGLARRASAGSTRA